MRWMLVGRVMKTTAPSAQLAVGAADNRVTQPEGLINATAARWRTNLGSFG